MTEAGIYADNQSAEALALLGPEAVYQANDVRGGKLEQRGVVGGLRAGMDAIRGSVEKLPLHWTFVEDDAPMTIGPIDVDDHNFPGYPGATEHP